MCDISVMREGGGLKVVIDVPLKGDEGDFLVVKIESIPVFSADLDEFVKLRLGEVMLVSRDFKFFAVSSGDWLKSCRKGERVTVCPANLPLILAVTRACEYFLYVSLPAKDCGKEVVLNFEGLFLKANGDWLFSVKT